MKIVYAVFQGVMLWKETEKGDSRSLQIAFELIGQRELSNFIFNFIRNSKT